jgi:L-aspartate oxidase
VSASAPCSPSNGWSQLADAQPDGIADSGADGGKLPGLLRPGKVPAALSRRFLVEFDTDACLTHECDVLVVGSGIAGLTAALAASKTRRVALVTKGRLTETNTWYAQGGIAGAVGEADSVELHLADTLVVGQGLCDEAVVRAVVGEAPEALAGLRDYGVRFDLAEGGEIALAREGGHSLPRVLHSGDATGAAIQRALTDALRASERVAVFEQRFLVDLLTDDDRCVGALVIDTATGAREVFWAGAVVLATGGAGQAYRVTTNPAIATGDGLAAAWRAGARVADLEFVQFHPTALDHDAAPRFLITEALRGEGAYLLDCSEERFMLGVHPLAELAPRDVVSREIEAVMARCGRDNVWLDARHLGEEYLRGRFPTIWEACAEAGYDLSRDLLPVAPAAHYLVGGVLVDVDGRSSLPGLYASGEVTASGLHGANRLASNSLLEGLVFSRRIARALQESAEPPRRRRISWVVSEASRERGARQGREPSLVSAAIKDVMQRHVGMSRSDEGLAGAAADLEMLGSPDVAAGDSAAELEVANLLTVGTLIAHAAWLRTESRGCHFRRDFPERRDQSWSVRVVQQRDEAPVRVGVEGHMMGWSGRGGSVGGPETPLKPAARSETE